MKTPILLLGLAALALAALTSATPLTAQETELKSVSAKRAILIPPQQDQPSTFLDIVLEAGPPQEITLDELLVRTLSHNLDIRIERYNEVIADDAIERAKGIYDPLLSASGQYAKSRTESTADSNRGASEAQRKSTYVRSQSVDAGISQLLSSGAVISANTGTDYSRVRHPGAGTRYNPLYTRSYTISVTQPLLRNFGPRVTNSQIDIALKQHAFAREQFRSQVQLQVAMVLQTYWELVFAISNADVQRQSLEAAENFLSNHIMIKFGLGAATRPDMLVAEADVATRKELLIVAKARIRTVQDQLKRQIKTDRPLAAWDVNLVPKDREPVFIEYPVDLGLSLEESLAHNPELQQLKINREILKINETVARNQKLPSLDIFASYGIMGVDDGHSKAESSAWSMDYDSASIGMQISYPLRNRAARAAHQQSLKHLEQNKVTVENAEDLLIQQVREIARNVTIARERIIANEAAVKAQDGNLEAQMMKFKEGAATPQDLLDFQEDLAQARSRRLRSIVDYNISIIALEQIKSTLLDSLDIKIESVSPRRD